ncbi:MAG: CRISPR-associated endonuclease Cas6 [Bacteroidia bacterium]|nr:CRISPR-associated endonuclease Cas6 [Bacteroidia bacterium]
MFEFRILKVIFQGEIEAYEIPAVRGGISGKVGPKHVLFHNHTQGGLRYAYPLIQYKRIGRRPALICLGDGVDEVHAFFEKRDWSIPVSGRVLDMRVDELDLHRHSLHFSERPYTYYLHQWIALNQENHHEYHELRDPDAQRALLERKLTGNLLSFAKGIGCRVDQQIEARILHLPPSRLAKFKQIQMHAFSPTFETNLHLPLYIGLGGKVSMGYGTLFRPRMPAEAGQEER